MSKPAPNTSRNYDPYWDQLLRPRQIEEETGVSWPTQKRSKPEDVVYLGPRAVAMTRRNAHRSIKP